MLSVAEALDLLLQKFSPLPAETVSINQALHRILAEDVASMINLPSFTNSSMDGFAVRSGDLVPCLEGNTVRLRITCDIPAGHPATQKLVNGEAHRIMTGAMLPPGANSVVPVEFTDQSWERPIEDNVEFVTISKAVGAGDFVRQVGEDVGAGEVVLRSGDRLNSQKLSMLAMVGVSEVKVIRKPRIAVCSSGDELVVPGSHLEPGKIYDSNSLLLTSLVSKQGVHVENLGIIRDNKLDVEAKLSEAVDRGADLIITTGGVSVGAYDYIRMVVEEKGSLDFWKVNMRPGKPFVFGQFRSTPFIGLPGNPVSAYVGFELFVREAISIMSGAGRVKRSPIQVIVDEDIQSDGRESYLRAIVYSEKGKHHARLTGHQGSGNLFSLVRANALLIVPSEVKSVRSGQDLTAWLFDDVGNEHP